MISEVLKQLLMASCGLLDTLLISMQVSKEQMFHNKRKECVFRSFLMQITTMDGVIEERFIKIENEELLRIIPISTVIGTRKLTEENMDRKRFSFLYK